jgi:CubicO group peptidase (beta-lactamase class C family)
MSLGILIEDFSTGKNTTPLPSSLTSLSWQTKVIDLLPDLWALDDKYASSKVSLSDLVSHVTGLPRHDLSYAPGQTVKSRIETLRDLKPTHELREKWSYNNIMYMALSHIIYTLSGTPYDAFVKERIFDVLGMHSTTFAHLVPQDSKARSQGWDAVSGRRIPLIDPRSAELIAGAGGVVSTAHDMVCPLPAYYLLLMKSTGEMATNPPLERRGPSHRIPTPSRFRG